MAQLNMNRQTNSLIQTLKEKKLTLALAESITCGMASEKLASCVGISDVLMGSVICYSPKVKTGLLGLAKKTIKKFSCESMEVTEKLAERLGRLIKADIHAALTGLAAPGGSETKEKPVGTVFICVIYKGKKFRLRKLFRGTPVEIRKKSCIALYDFILKCVRA
ncbi:MAG: CinA family protein [Bacteroidia bacterium]